MIYMKITKNTKKILAIASIVIVSTHISYTVHLSGYKKDCLNKYNTEPTITEQQLIESRDIIEKQNQQLKQNEIAIKEAHNEINSLKAKCKDCTYSTSWGE